MAFAQSDQIPAILTFHRDHVPVLLTNQMVRMFRFKNPAMQQRVAFEGVTGFPNRLMPGVTVEQPFVERGENADDDEPDGCPEQ
jgi:hypothetical protein